MADLPARWEPVLAPLKRPVSGPRDAEIFAAEAMGILGFDGVDLTAPGADAGLDVVAQNAVAQVKHQEKPVGRPELQKLTGAAGGRRMLFFSSGGYSSSAVEYGDAHMMELFQYSVDGDIASVGSAAVQLVNALGGAVEPTSVAMQNIAARTGWCSTSLSIVTAELTRLYGYSRPKRKERSAMRQCVPLTKSVQLGFENLDRLTRQQTKRPRQEGKRMKAMARQLAKIERSLTKAAAVLGLQLPAPPAPTTTQDSLAERLGSPDPPAAPDSPPEGATEF